MRDVICLHSEGWGGYGMHSMYSMPTMDVLKIDHFLGNAHYGCPENRSFSWNCYCLHSEGVGWVGYVQ